MISYFDDLEKHKYGKIIINGISLYSDIYNAVKNSNDSYYGIKNYRLEELKIYFSKYVTSCIFLDTKVKRSNFNLEFIDEYAYLQLCDEIESKLEEISKCLYSLQKITDDIQKKLLQTEERLLQVENKLENKL